MLWDRLGAIPKMSIESHSWTGFTAAMERSALHSGTMSVQGDVWMRHEDRKQVPTISLSLRISGPQNSFRGHP